MKKDDRLWIAAVCVCDVLICLVFLILLFGLWSPDESSSDGKFTFNQICFLQVFVQILNMVGISALLDYRYPDGTAILPIPQKMGFLLNGIIFLGLLVWGNKMSIQPGSPLWHWLLPTVVSALWFFILLGIGLYQPHKQQKAADTNKS